VKVTFQYLICSLVNNITWHIICELVILYLAIRDFSRALSRTSRYILDEYRENRPFSTRPRDLARKFAGTDMQLDQVEKFEASRKDGSQDEVSRVICCLLFLARRRERGIRRFYPELLLPSWPSKRRRGEG